MSNFLSPNIRNNQTVLMFGVFSIMALLSSEAHGSNIMPPFSTVTPIPNPSGWGNSSGGIDLYSLDKVDGFQARDDVLEVISTGAGSSSNILTVGGDHAVFGSPGSQLEAYLWVPDSWRTKGGPDGTVDTDMLGIIQVPTFDWIYYPAIGFSNESGTGLFKVWDASRESGTDPSPTYGCNGPDAFTGPPANPNPLHPCWVYLDGTATDRGGDTVPYAPVYYNQWNKLTADFTPDLNIVYSVNDIPIYTAILDAVVVGDEYIETTQMIAQDFGIAYIAYWSLPEPSTYALVAIGGVAAFGFGKGRRARARKST